MSGIGLAVVVGSVILAAAARAAPGDLDPTFSGDGKQFTDFPYGVDRAAAAVPQPDGKIVVVGRALRDDSGDGDAYDFAIARYDPDGTLDPSFSGDGLRTASFAGGRGPLVDDRATGVAVQADGKIVVVGTTNGGGVCCRTAYSFALARFNPDGTLDQGFSGDGRQTTRFADDGGAAAVGIQGDGRIVAVGNACRDGGGCNFALARYNPNGSLDTTFSGDGRQTTNFGSARDSANDVALGADGKIIAVGAGGAKDDFALARYNPNGSLDGTFTGDGKQTTDFGGSDAATGAAVQGNGRIVVTGTSGSGGAFARYMPNGALDPSFSGDGKEATEFLSPSDVTLQDDGTILAVGAAGGDFGLVRYLPNGTLDPGFSGDGRLRTTFGGADEAAAVALQDGGRIVAAGATCRNGCDFAAARYDATGTLDPSFAGDGKQRTSFGGFKDGAGAVAVQSDGKIVAVGHTGVIQSKIALARYNPDGTLDTSFSGDGMRTLDFGGYEGAAALEIQPDGKIVVAGSRAPRIGGVYRFAVARLNPDGTLDTSFSGDGKVTTGFAGGGTGADVALQADGKIIVVGTSGVGTEGGACCFALARYNPDGTLDPSFSGDGRQTTEIGDAYASAGAVVLQGSKIVVAGSGGPYTSDFAVARYNANGSLDPTFSGDGTQTTDFGAFDGAGDVALQGAKIIAIGGGYHPNGAYFAMARYNSNGSLDTSFAGDGKQTDGFGPANAGVVTPSGDIVAVGGRHPGNFDVARYDPSGNLDPSFSGDGIQETHVGEAALGGGATGVALQSDGKIVAAGSGVGPTGTSDLALIRYLGS